MRFLVVVLLASLACDRPKDVDPPPPESRGPLVNAALLDAGSWFARGEVPPVRNLRCTSDADCEAVVFAGRCCGQEMAVPVSWRDPDTAARVRAQASTRRMSCDSKCTRAFEFRSPCIQNVCQLEVSGRVRLHGAWVSTGWVPMDAGALPALDYTTLYQVDGGVLEAGVDARDEPVEVPVPSSVSEPARAPAPVRGVVQLEAPAVDPKDVDPEALAAFVRARKAVIEACYEFSLKREPSLKGRLVAHFYITDQGKPVEVEFKENTLSPEDRVIEACLRITMSDWRFPFRPKRYAKVAYPFVFTPAL